MIASFRYLLSLALLLGIATPALADTPLEPASCKVPGARRIVVDRFRITVGELNAFKQTHRFATRPPGATAQARTADKRATLGDLIAVISTTPGSARKSIVPNDENPPDDWCGIVDNWHYAALVAYQQCNSQGASNGNAYFKADTSYDTFNDTQNHHARYQPFANVSLADNDIVLEGDCYICWTTRSAGTATTIPRSQIKVLTPVEEDKKTSPRR